jgi:hypothetical protein
MICANFSCNGTTRLEIGNDRLGPCTSVGLQPASQTLLPPLNASSPWLLPWKAYQDTWPGGRLRSSAGIRLPNLEPAQFEVLAAIIGAVGFGRVTFGVPWSGMEFEPPTALTAAARTDLLAKLLSAKGHGLRPTLRLHAPTDTPVPVQRFTVTLLEPASQGSRTVVLDPVSIKNIVPGRSGLDDGSRAAGILIVKVDATGVATLSAPLSSARPEGEHKASTLRFAPFPRPLLANKQPNLVFNDSIAGFIGFAKAVSSVAESVLGESGFDVVLWGTGADGEFSSSDNYYSPSIDTGPGLMSDEGPREILTRTAAALDAGRTGRFGVGDGFVDVTVLFPDNASNEPAGSNAIVRQQRINPVQLPSAWGNSQWPMLDAQGNVSGAANPDDNWVPGFLPTLNVFFPERSISAVTNSNVRPGQTWRELSPIETDLGPNGTYGRNVLGRADQHVSVWLDPAGLIFREAEVKVLSPLQLQRTFAKSTMRTLTAFISKGATAVNVEPFQEGATLIDAKSPGGGVGFSTIARFFARFSGDNAGVPVVLTQINSCETDKQFVGDGTSRHPDLLNRDVVFTAPFRVAPNRVVVAAYVMTYDLLSPHQPNADEAHRLDLPAKPFRLTFATTAATAISATAYDPLDDSTVPVKIVQSGAAGLVVDAWLADSPRLITIEGI